LNQEHPTCTERKSLNYECGWKGGDRGGLAERKKWKKLRKEQKKLLTVIGLLMEGPTVENLSVEWFFSFLHALVLPHRYSCDFQVLRRSRTTPDFQALFLGEPQLPFGSVGEVF